MPPKGLPPSAPERWRPGTPERGREPRPASPPPSPSPPSSPVAADGWSHGGATAVGPAAAPSPPSSPRPPPPAPPPPHKLRAPGGEAGAAGGPGIAAYQADFRRRLDGALQAHGLTPAHLVDPQQKSLPAEEVRRRFRAFRVAVVMTADGPLALANTQAAGGSGKFTLARRPGGPLMAAKTVATRQKAGAKTAPMSEARIAREVGHLGAYFDPAVTSLRLEPSAKHLILSPLGLSDLAHLPPALGDLRASLARRAMAEVGEQLSHLHRDGYLHGDIKPANLVVMADGRVRLIDMGEVERPEHFDMPATPLFGAPEALAFSQEVGLGADVWSLGLTLAWLRHPPPARLAATGAGWLDFLAATEALWTGLSWAASPPSAREAEGGDAAAWAQHFRQFRALDPELAAVVLERLLVPVAARARADEVVALARTLPDPGAGRLAAACQQLGDSPSRRAVALALDLRLADEAAAAAPAGS